jgi:hypothetical protein
MLASDAGYLALTARSRVILPATQPARNAFVAALKSAGAAFGPPTSDLRLYPR